MKNNNTDKVIQHTKGAIKVKATAWGESIIIADNAFFVAYVNPFGDTNKGIPSEDDRTTSEIICKAVNSHDALIENLKRLIDRIEENELGELFPSALFRAKEALKKAE